jgi:hypothetical protein
MFRSFDLSFFISLEFRIEMAKIETLNLNEDPIAKI